LIGLGVALGAGLVAAPTVAVLPIESPVVGAAERQRLERSMRRALRPAVLSRDHMRERLGMVAEAVVRSCGGHPECLADTGRTMGVDRVLRTQIRALGSDYGVRLSSIRSSDGALLGSTRWRMAPQEAEEALATLVRRAVLPPDVTFDLVLHPTDAEVRLYGDPVAWSAGSIEEWSGSYRMEVVAPGHVPVRTRIVLPPPDGRLAFELDPDPLAVVPSETGSGSGAPVFGEDARSVGSGATLETLRLQPEAPPRRPWWRRAAPWAVVVASAVAVGVGVAVAADAQSSYDEVAAEERGADTTTGVQAAVRLREDMRSQATTGDALWVTGSVVGAGALIWGLVELL
jgi:hypothetical protein